MSDRFSCAAAKARTAPRAVPGAPPRAPLALWRRVAAATLAIALLPLCLAAAGCSPGLERVPVMIGGERFSVEVARTDEQKRTGLMNRRSLGRREGMLFVYDRDQQLAFWMKNTSIPLTLAFLSREGVVLQVEDLKPHSLKSVVSERAARYALEVPQGVLQELGVRVGDTVELPPGFE